MNALLRALSAAGFTVALLVAAWLGSPAGAFGEEPGATVQLHIVEVPAERSGLSHVINSDPQRYGNVKWLWMSPLVDIDGDGHLDLIVYGHHGGTGPGGVAGEGGAAAVWLGRGDGTFAFDERGYEKRWAFGARDPIWMDLTGNGAMDGLVTEFARVGVGRVLINDGSGHWQRTSLVAAGMWIDTNGDGHIDGLWNQGELRRMEPPLSQWGPQPPEKLAFTTVWNAEEALGWPEGVERGRHGGWHEAYAVDLTGDDRNELVVQVKGPGFHTSQLVTWVLARGKDSEGRETWIDTTAQRSLPTGVGHCLYPEDVDADGAIDLVDLETGFWYRNDGSGHFARSPERIYDPETRDFKRGRRGRAWTPDCDLEWIDLTNNGYRDLVIGLAHAGPGGATFLNLGGGRFVEVEAVPRYCRGRKLGDVDGDRRIDMIEIIEGQPRLLRNETPHGGVELRLVPAGHATAHLGAKVWVYRAGGLGKRDTLLHYRQGFMVQRLNRSNVISPNLHVGLGDVEAVDIRVRFPSGVIREVKGAKAGASVAIAEEE